MKHDADIAYRRVSQTRVISNGEMRDNEKIWRTKNLTLLLHRREWEKKVKEIFARRCYINHFELWQKYEHRLIV